VFLQEALGYPGGFVRVVDFGLWRLAGERRGPGVVADTARYTSPELTLGRDASVDGRTDQFALAAIAYRLIGGVDAFPRDDVAAVLDRVLHQQPRRLTEIVSCDPAVDAVIRRGLAKDPALRFATVAAFASALEQAVSGHGLELTEQVCVAALARDQDLEGATLRDVEHTFFDEGEPATAAPHARPDRGSARHPPRHRLALLALLLGLTGGLAWSLGWPTARSPSSAWHTLAAMVGSPPGR
jgi:serine/threonine-protein kinase